MKKLGLILIFSNFIFPAFSQPPGVGEYLENKTMLAFHGTWRWVNGVDTFQIYLMTKKVHFEENGGFDWDRLLGWHTYKHGNVIIENSMNDFNNPTYRTFDGSNSQNPSGVVTGFFKDLTRKKTGKVTLTLSPDLSQLTWNIQSTPGLKARKPTDPPYQPGFSVPTNMILTKL